MYDVTCINGLIDRPCFHSLFKIEQLEEEALIVRNSTPVLAPVSRFKDDFDRPTYHYCPQPIGRMKLMVCFIIKISIIYLIKRMLHLYS